MADTPPTSKPRFLHRRYLLDRTSQLPFAGWVTLILAGIGLLYAFAVYFLLGTEFLLGKPLADTRLGLLLVHSAYFLVGGAILYVTVLLLTHRYVGPAFVIRRALTAMRHGDFTERLSLRGRDFHKQLAEEVRLLRDELAEREAARADAYVRLEEALEAGDVVRGRCLLDELRACSAAERHRRAQEAERSAEKAA